MTSEISVTKCDKMREKQLDKSLGGKTHTNALILGNWRTIQYFREEVKCDNVTILPLFLYSLTKGIFFKNNISIIGYRKTGLNCHIVTKRTHLSIGETPSKNENRGQFRRIRPTPRVEPSRDKIVTFLSHLTKELPGFVGDRKDIQALARRKEKSPEGSIFT